jgi:hypothetical protein
MTETPATAEDSFHKRMAVSLFNDTWKLLDKPNRTTEETDRMIHAAHASRLHWEYVGTPKNLSIGEWQVARVHAVVRHADAALYHAQRCMEISAREQLGPFYAAYAHEAIARALSLTGHADVAQHLAAARELASEIADVEEKKMLEADLATIAVGRMEKT